MRVIALFPQQGGVVEQSLWLRARLFLHDDNEIFLSSCCCSWPIDVLLVLRIDGISPTLRAFLTCILNANMRENSHSISNINPLK